MQLRRGENWRLTDALSDASYDRDGSEMAASGLYVELQPWTYCFFPGKEWLLR